jgi:CheY-like chemotaxis protein
MQVGQAEQNELCVSTRLDGTRVVIEVCDTGAGIPASEIDRIFDAFYTTKPVGVGTGLGLAICQRIITDMGGELTVTSTVGKGSTFRISLLVAGADEAVPVPVYEPVAPTSRRARILLVDDEELVLRSIKRTLAKEHDVTAVLAASEALALCARGAKFDLILCDLMMPDMTGMDLQRELLLLVPDQAHRMVFVTGGAFTEQARQFLTDLPNQYLEKPFDQTKLRGIVQRYTRQATVPD